MSLPARALDAAIGVLEAHGIDYAVTGSLAGAWHGYIRATLDADVKVLADEEDLARCAADVDRLFRRIDADTWVFQERFTIDLYRVVDDLDRRAFRSRTRVRLFPDLDRTYWVVGLEPLLVLKVREYARHGDAKHLVDVRELLARNADTLDVTELERLLALDPAWGKVWDAHVEKV